jgi:hypothetical protein
MAGCSSCVPIFREATAPYIELGFEPKTLADRLVERLSQQKRELLTLLGVACPLCGWLFVPLQLPLSRR